MFFEVVWFFVMKGTQVPFYFFTISAQPKTNKPIPIHPSPITHHPSPITHHPSPITQHS
jgi:hypothetical protein